MTDLVAAPTAASLDACYAKTPAGRREIQTRELALSRAARNLLLIVDASRSVDDWLARVHGAGVDEWQALVDHGLIERVGAEPPVARTAPMARLGAATVPLPPGAVAALAKRGSVTRTVPLTPTAMVAAAAASARAGTPLPSGPVAGTAPVAAAAATPPLAPVPVPVSETLEQVLQRLDYQTIYDRVTELARAHLGLIKGYKLVLDLERCPNPAAVRALALRFVAMVREQRGERDAQRLARQIAGLG